FVLMSDYLSTLSEIGAHPKDDRVTASTLSCAPEASSIVATFSVDLDAEAVQDALQTCNNVPAVGQFCSDDSGILGAAADYHQNECFAG
ncbi:MAG: hypothetical protein KDD60_08285, partial [Bdellovibrionales bacterium]|nr:hypothetical protein [Bdellovibrionales bacterium]